MSVSPTEFDQLVGKAIDNRAELKLFMTYIVTGADPTSVITPDFIGQEAYDTAGANFYKATTAISSGWRVIHA